MFLNGKVTIFILNRLVLSDSLCFFLSHVQNSTHNTAQVTLFNEMKSHTWPDGSVSMPSARLQVPILCSYINSVVISAGYSPLV